MIQHFIQGLESFLGVKFGPRLKFKALRFLIRRHPRPTRHKPSPPHNVYIERGIPMGLYFHMDTLSWHCPHCREVVMTKKDVLAGGQRNMAEQWLGR